MANRSPRGKNEPQHYTDIGDFFENFLRFIWNRDLTSTSRQWCRLWWKHDEAKLTMESLWLTWEQIAAEDDAWSMVQYLSYLDTAMNRLTAPGGTFRHCHSQHVDEDEYIDDEAPYATAPRGLVKNYMATPIY